ncbi:MAG: hypothetical protein CL535_03470 [Ahrensia sp.]|nr:hypothetical protein [Ahrensia sp.]|tara:strand:+ start:59588 stop:59800 length:213 start_codon:yes stop_codon:yes gene_type:complete
MRAPFLRSTRAVRLVLQFQSHEIIAVVDGLRLDVNQSAVVSERRLDLLKSFRQVLKMYLPCTILKIRAIA